VLLVVVQYPGTPAVMVLVCVISPLWLGGQLSICVSDTITAWQVLLVVVQAPATPFVIVLVCVIEPVWLAGQLKNWVSMLTTGAGA
jgi:hypothetical protein